MITFSCWIKSFEVLFFLVSRTFYLSMDLLGFNLGVTKDGKLLIDLEKSLIQWWINFVSWFTLIKYILFYENCLHTMKLHPFSKCPPLGMLRLLHIIFLTDVCMWFFTCFPCVYTLVIEWPLLQAHITRVFPKNSISKFHWPRVTTSPFWYIPMIRFSRGETKTLSKRWNQPIF